RRPEPCRDRRGAGDLRRRPGRLDVRRAAPGAGLRRLRRALRLVPADRVGAHRGLAHDNRILGYDLSRVRTPGQSFGFGGRCSEMKWVTRKNANVDRVACPWLIRRFVDPDAEFLYVPAEEVAAVAEREPAIPYDVQGVELGHVDGRCSFESIMVKYGLTDSGLELLARIVHGADVAADIGIVPEAAGLKAIAHGFALVHGDDDHEKIRLP